MSAFVNREVFKKEAVTGMIFWIFWAFLFGVFFAGIKTSAVEGLKVASAIILPSLIPVHIISGLFNWFLSRKKIIIFIIIAFPLVWIMGLAIDRLSGYFISDGNTASSYGMLIFIFAAMYIGFRYTRIAISQRILIKEAENKRVLSELQLLRSQLNPHFLFNALNSIYSLIISRSDKAGEAVLSLSELMRFHIDSSGKLTVPLRKEFEMISQFIELEKMRLSAKCTITIDTEIINESAEIAPLIFMPFVENAFKYSISGNPADNFISLYISSDQNVIIFKISNSIAKNSNKLHENGSKIGIENTRKRLDLHYGNNYTLDIQNSGSQFNVQLKIMLSKS